MRFENLSPYDMKILWDRSEFTDANSQRHRLMHSGVRYQDRNNPIPDQVVQSRSVVQEAVIPISNVYFRSRKRPMKSIPCSRLTATLRPD